MHLSTPSPLVYLNLSAGREQIHWQEDPLINELALQHPHDDPRLLTVLGIISNNPRPLAPIKISRLPGLLILWLGSHEWLALPARAHRGDLEQALLTEFQSGISLEPIPDGTFDAQLSASALERLSAYPSHQLSKRGEPQPHESICIRPWQLETGYDLLLGQQDAAILQQWLQELH